MADAQSGATNRRDLKFESLDQILVDATRMATAPHRCLGKWSLGQICEHLAISMRLGMDGQTFQVPFYIRMVGPFLKKRILTRPMPPGFKLPASAEKVLVPNPSEDQAGLAKLREVIERAAREIVPAYRHPVLGKLTRQEWEQLHMRHSELHLSFVVPA